jgi:hypothetical protein
MFTIRTIINYKKKNTPRGLTEKEKRYREAYEKQKKDTEEKYKKGGCVSKGCPNKHKPGMKMCEHCQEKHRENRKKKKKEDGRDLRIHGGGESNRSGDGPEAGS